MVVVTERGCDDKVLMQIIVTCTVFFFLNMIQYSGTTMSNGQATDRYRNHVVVVVVVVYSDTMINNKRINVLFHTRIHRRYDSTRWVPHSVK
jgi:hypothetical protein